jgi:PII-like signaling protein
MQIPEQAMLLRIFLGEDDRTDGRPLYEAIVLKAREMHLAGATVLRGPMGFGKTSRLHTAKILRLSEDLPVVVEIVEAEERIRAFLSAIEPMMNGGLITLEKAQVVRYGSEPEAP